MTIPPINSSTYYPNQQNDDKNLASEKTILPKLPFNNLHIASENFLAKISKQLLDSNYVIFPKFTQIPLPKLDKEQLNIFYKILTTPILLKGRNKDFEIVFTLAELFNDLLQAASDLKIFIEKIELVGWLLIF